MIEATKILNDIFSKDGYCTQYFCIKANNHGININITKDNDNYMIIFRDKKPQVILNKFIKVSADLNYILLTPEKGFVSIGILPKIPFNYSWNFYHISEIDNID